MTTTRLDHGDDRLATRGTLLGSVLPMAVESEERFGDAPGGSLFPEEAQVVAHATPRRQHEYATVRECARACLGRFGYPRMPLLPRAGGAPGWPTGVRGSLTHCPGYAAAAVGLSREIAGLGIDAEPDAPLPDGVVRIIATPAERSRLAQSWVQPGMPHWDRLLFSAKEAVYKAWFPLVGEWLDPQETEVVFDPSTATFTATLSRDDLVLNGSTVTRLHGRWGRGAGILVTAVVLEQPYRLEPREITPSRGAHRPSRGRAARWPSG